HQVEAIENIRNGKNVVVLTGTASGKTLCYNIPVLETLLTNPTAKALYMFPTKALAQDQLRGLRRWAELEPSLARIMKTGTYDGDTPQTTRRKLRDEASIILTNPDMLHQGILPYHTRWNRFLSDLHYVIIDEIHTYRGVFGSNVANVIRRLNRICEFYGSKPQFICCSATIANPLELAQKLTGIPMVLVDNDGSPRGAKLFVLWNPPIIDVGAMERRSSNVEAQMLMTALIKNGVQTIAFGRARIVAELMYKYVRDALKRSTPELADKVRPYRGGYLPEERREIEKQLFSGELLGVTSTNALELGIDIGSLDASIIVGFPGTIASTWQQAGRAGRGLEESLVIFVAYNDPIDQYLMRRPDYFFAQSPESAIIDPQNPYILASHLRCAAFELPLKENDSRFFGNQTSAIAEVIEEEGHLKQIENVWYYSKMEFPAKDVNLRTISDNTFTIVELSTADGRQTIQTEKLSNMHSEAHLCSHQIPEEANVIGQVDAISAPEILYPQAVYIHEGETYLVDELDLQGKVAYVRRAEVDYYTQAILDASIRIQYTKATHYQSTTKLKEAEEHTSKTSRDEVSDFFPLEKSWAGCKICYGQATVTWATTGFKKIKFYSLDSIGYGKVNLPPQHLETMAVWIVPPQDLLDEIQRQGMNPIEGLVGIRNLSVHVLPLFAMCDKQDIGGIVDSSNTGLPTIFIYDRYPGGLGFAEKGYEMVESLMYSCLEMIEECKCEEGCPSCVGIPILRPPIHTDPDIFGASPIPNKETAMAILKSLCGGKTR
ncbi:MAG: DEAD/DEAH box helicase, partial [Armatimonadota bacterium]|nr:DEAD/DEAH box helicase [Armatimonadota bacterium]